MDLYDFDDTYLITQTHPLQMSENNKEAVQRREKVDALISVAKYNPKFTVGIIALGIFAAALEGVGLSFMLPIVEIVQSSGDPAQQVDGGLMSAFVMAYQIVGLPLTLGTAILGVAAVMTIRFTSSFLVLWFGEALRTYYIEDLQKQAFSNALNAEVAYFDAEGSDDILNAIITQTYYAGRVIQRVIQLLQDLFLALVYLLVAFVISPLLTVFTIVVLGGITYLLRNILEPGYDIGDRVADANERRQEAAQAGTQGIRDIRIFGVADELYEDFTEAVRQYTRSRITLRRNEAAIDSFYNLAVAVSVFGLIYFALTFADLAFGSLAVFLFAMFRVGPTMSRVNQKFYQVENDLPHLVRTQEFTQTLAQRKEPNEADRPAPNPITEIEFDDVWFSYNEDEDVLRGIDFEAEKGEFVAFVGQSGAGKSTIVSLLARLYRATGGEIRANGIPISEIDIDEWRDRITVVRQNPYIFSDTLEYNLTIGNRDATREEIERVCEIAKVDEFLESLPAGYDTLLGDEGVRLSGGQKQRVAIARALLDDADLLILDEATSDLDSNLEEEVQRGIEGMERDYIIVTIAHRLSTVKNADRIYTVEAGRITEAGQHQELVQQGGKYSELYSIQARG